MITTLTYNFSISNKLLIYGESLYLKKKIVDLLTQKEKYLAKSYPVYRKSTKKGAVKLNLNLLQFKGVHSHL